jgi:hypothetical protein
MDNSPFDLNGRWTDINAVGSPEITITHDLNTNTLRAEYCGLRQCRDWNGAVLKETTFDFEGTLEGNRLEGRINVCNFGKAATVKGWVLEQLELIVSDSGDRLDGRYFCRVDENWVTVSITRRSHASRSRLYNSAAVAMSGIVSREVEMAPNIPKALTDRERQLERMIAQDERELARVEAQHDAQGKKFASAIKTLQANIDRHLKERDQIISEINDISMKQYEEDQKTGGIGQTR